MPPSRAALVGPYTRALREALESAAGVERAAALLTRALSRAQLGSVPEELEAFRRFTDVPLRRSMAAHLSPAEVDAIFERIEHVLWMATSDVQSRGIEVEVEEGSGQRSLSPAPFRVPVLPPTLPPTQTPAIVIDAWRARVGRTEAEPTEAEATGGALVAPPTEPRAVALGRTFHTRPPSVVEVGLDAAVLDTTRHPRPVLLEVLVITLDPRLVFETDDGLSGRGRVSRISTAAELAQLASRATAPLVVVVDSALPSIDLPTFAPISGTLPLGTRVVLWGVDERQKQRLAVMFPAAKNWIASGRAASPAEVILDL